MCNFNITVDDNKLTRNYPGIDSEKFGHWLQKWVDDMMVEEDAELACCASPNAHTYDEMKETIRERIDMIEAGNSTFYSNDEVFLSIRERYGL